LIVALRFDLSGAVLGKIWGGNAKNLATFLVVASKHAPHFANCPRCLTIEILITLTLTLTLTLCVKVLTRCGAKAEKNRPGKLTVGLRFVLT